MILTRKQAEKLNLNSRGLLTPEQAKKAAEVQSWVQEKLREYRRQKHIVEQERLRLEQLQREYDAQEYERIRRRPNTMKLPKQVPLEMLEPSTVFRNVGVCTPQCVCVCTPSGWVCQ